MSADPRLELAALNRVSATDFAAQLDGIYEHSPWIAERAAAARPFASRLELLAAMQAVVLADSFAKNFRPVTLEMPKMLMPLASLPMIEYTLEFLATAGVQEVFLGAIFVLFYISRCVQHIWQMVLSNAYKFFKFDRFDKHCGGLWRPPHPHSLLTFWIECLVKKP